MKIKLILFAFTIVFSTIAFSQTYHEIKENGWGFAMQMCKPALADLDQDGLIDMLVGTRLDNLVHFEQAVAGTDSFVLVSESFNNIEINSRTAPCFTDLDTDGLIDLLIGSNTPNIALYEQSAIGSLIFTLQSDTFIIDPSSYLLSPTITDFENDGILDLIIGTYNGFLRYYKQDAISSTSFSLISSTFTSTDFGTEAAPCFTDLNHDGLLDLIIGGNGGRFMHYNQDVVGDTLFSIVTDHFNNIDLGYISSANFVDLDHDGQLDFITGNSHGKLGYYEQDSINSVSFSLIDNDLIKNIDVDALASPAVIDLDGDNLLDICIGMDKARIFYYEQKTVGSSSLLLKTERWNDWDIGNFARPVFTDIDHDNLIDLIIGEMDNRLFYFEQDAVGSTTFSQISNNLSNLVVEKLPSPCFSDIDNDGLLDLLIGNDRGTIQYFEQDNPNDTTFILISTYFNGIDVGTYSTPTITDLDNDGKFDLVIGCSNGNLFHYEQNAINDTAFTLVTENFADIKVLQFSTPTFADIDGDGLKDLLVGDNDGGVHYFQREHAVGINDDFVSGSNTLSFQLFPAYPNPFNPGTTINFSLAKESNVSLKVFDLLGQEVSSLVNNQFMNAGSYAYKFDASKLASGTYIYRLEAGDFVQKRKMLLIK